MSSDTKGKINVSVCNMYREPAYGSEIINQGLLGEKILIKTQSQDFAEIELSDGYRGWISNYQWVTEKSNTYSLRRLRKHFVKVYQNPDLKSESIRDGVIGTELAVVSEKNNWFQIILPDGLDGWIDKSDIADFPENTREGVIQLAKEFLGYPYYWGGRSPKGFDCSGLMQTVFALVGVDIPRDSWMQQRDGKYISDKPENAEPGDLYFFADTGTKISHVGIALGEGRLIHSRGMVRENSLIKGSTDYSEGLYHHFVDVRSYF